jgi:hypothetical protein
MFGRDSGEGIKQAVDRVIQNYLRFSLAYSFKCSLWGNPAVHS